MKLERLSFRDFAGICRLSVLLSALLLTSLLTSGCADQSAKTEAPETTETAQATSNAERAAQMAQDLLIIDGHVDLPYRLEAQMEDVSVRTESGDFDYVRAKEGGLDAPFMSIYIPATYQETGGAKDFADSLIDMVETLAADNADKFRVVKSTDEVLAAKADGVIALPLGIENGAPVEGDLANLQHFYDRGVRYITLTHSKNNHICDSSYEDADERKWKGLSDFGKTVVAEMNRLGIMVDISHVSDDAFFQVMEITQAPAIASHSSARHFTPGFERNMSDEMIQALAKNGGVIMINYGSGFLTEEAQGYSSKMMASLGKVAEEQGLDRNDPDDRKVLMGMMDEYKKETPYPYADVADVVAHIDHVVQLVGVDHVGLGSDFDGVGDTLPTGLKDASETPNLIEALLDKGYSEEDVEKILSGNALRVWKAVEAKAAELQSLDSAAY